MKSWPSAVVLRSSTASTIGMLVTSTGPLVLVPTKSSRDDPFVTVTLEEIQRRTPIGATAEHHGLCWARIDGCNDIHHVVPSFRERTSRHVAEFRRDNLNPCREPRRYCHREAVSSIQGAGK